jgi:hypothetical protein
MKYTDKDKQRALIDACNLICEHVQSRLCDGCSIVLEMNTDEASLTLFDPDGFEIECLSSDAGISQIDELCVMSMEHDEANETDEHCAARMADQRREHEIGRGDYLRDRAKDERAEQ